MQVSSEQAHKAFRRLNVALQIPSLHPYYVVADAKREAGLTPVFFLHEQGENIYYHAFHVARVNETQFVCIQSAYPYGGAVASRDDPAFLSEACSAWNAWCQEHQVLAEVIRFHPLLDNWRYFPGEVVDERETVWIDLQAEDPLWGNCRTRHRRKVRRARKHGAYVEQMGKRDLLKLFPDMYYNLMQKHHANQFYFFPRAYFESMLTWEQAQSFVCKVDNECLAVAIFLVSSVLIEYHLGATSPRARELGAFNLLMQEAITYGRQIGASKLHLGGGTDSRPENPLFFFKAGFSPLRATFKIGKRIHQQEVYAALKSRWDRNITGASDRLLFDCHGQGEI